MLTLSLTLPSSFSEESLHFIHYAFEDISSGFTAAGVHKRSDSDWIISILYDEDVHGSTPDQMALARRFMIGCEMAGVSCDVSSLPDWMIARVPETDWLAESYQSFPPFSIGPFFLHGSHYDGDVPADALALQIDAATAFGTGEHGTTKGCLQAMIAMKEDGVCPWNVLDMGTGSGILAIAAWKLWQTPILAVDVEEESVRVALKHADDNGVAVSASALTCTHGDGFETPDVQTRQPFDFIIANILAGPLIEMAQACMAVSDENGIVLLSGMLTTQADDVLAVYETYGAVLVERIDIGEWSSLVLRNTDA